MCHPVPYNAPAVSALSPWYTAERTIAPTAWLQRCRCDGVWRGGGGVARRVLTISISQSLREKALGDSADGARTTEPKKGKALRVCAHVQKQALIVLFRWLCVI